MKAWVLEDIGNIKYKEVLKPQISENEVLVQVKAAGICGSDIPRIYQTGAHQMPLIPGHEFSGQVVQTGENADVKWQNKRVGIFPLIPCHNCVACQKGQYELCRNYSYLGSRRDGGFAEYVAVPECNLIELPENVSYEEAAMLEPMSVACHALRRVKVSPDDTVAVCGLGTTCRPWSVRNRRPWKRCASRIWSEKDSLCAPRKGVWRRARHGIISA